MEAAAIHFGRKRPFGKAVLGAILFFFVPLCVLQAITPNSASLSGSKVESIPASVLDPLGPVDPLISFQRWALDHGLDPKHAAPPEVMQAHTRWLLSHPQVGNFQGDGRSGPAPACAVPPPAPTGVTVMNVLSSYCTLLLTWTAVSPSCDGAVTYNVYRDGSLINASPLTVTTYQDVGPLAAGTTYNYTIRSVDAFGEGVDSTVVSGSPGATVATVGEEFEPGGAFQNSGWTIKVLSAPGAHPDPDPWMGTATNPNIGTGDRFDLDWPDGTYPAFPAAGFDPGGERALVSPVFNLSSGSTLTFWHTWSYENNYGGAPSSTCGAGGVACYDGGVLEYKHPADPNWTRITLAQITGSTYNGKIDSSHVTDNPLGFNLDAWVGGTGTLPAYAQATVSIGSLAGAGDAQVRWLQADDTGDAGGGNVGWFVDSVAVTNVNLSGTCTTLSACSAPGSPALVSVAASCPGGIDLTWTAGTGSTGSYNVYRSVFSGGPYQKINTAPVLVTTYTDATANPDLAYYYVVRGACDVFGVFESANSNQLSATSPAALSAPAVPTFSSTGATSVTVSWSSVSGATSYDLYRFTGACSGSGSLIVSQSGTSYTDTGLSASTQYGYYVVARKDACYSPDGSCASVTTAGPPPGTPYGGGSGTAMTASKTVADGSTIQVVWDSSTCSATDTDYEVVYGTNSQLPTSYGGTYGVSGVVCSLGLSGTYSWSSTPSVSAGNFEWFVVVAHDGQMTEGPWGQNSGSVDRIGPGPSGSSNNASGCTRNAKLLTNPCGQ